MNAGSRARESFFTTENTESTETENTEEDAD
jgi:hypothetical protein